MDEYHLEKIASTIYERIVKNLLADTCNMCPIVKVMGGLSEIIRDGNSEKILNELRISIGKMECPFKN